MTIRELFADVLDYSVTDVLAIVGAVITGWALLQIAALLLFWWIDRDHDRSWPRWP